MLMNYIHAFWVGGLICALVQILLDKTRLMPGRVMVLLVCTGSVLSALHLYEPLVDYAGAGASVPLIGFGHLLFQGVKEEMEQVGVLGVFTGGLKAMNKIMAQLSDRLNRLAPSATLAMSRWVQSAHRPVCRRAAQRGAMSRPMLEAPNSSTSGFSSSTASTITLM